MSQQTRQFGFTLVELMVSIALFAMIVVAASSGLVASVARERSVRAEVALQKSMYTFLDQLESEIHLAQSIGCGSLESDCVSGDTVLVLRSVSGDLVTYELVDGSVTRVAGADDPLIALTSFAGQIDQWTVFVRGAASSDQYSLVVSLSGTASTGKEIFASRYITPYTLDTND